MICQSSRMIWLKIYCNELNKSGYKTKMPCQACYLFAVLFLSPLLNCQLVICDLRCVRWSKHHCKLTRQNSWWARSTLCVTALIAWASAGRWAAGILLASRQPPPPTSHLPLQTPPRPPRHPPPFHRPSERLAKVQNEFRQRSAT